MLFKNALAALFLASGIAAVPEGKSILGYRTVKKAEAEKINAAGAPVYEEGVYYGGGKQIGPGVYTSPYPGAWKQIRGKWVCVFYIDSKSLDRVAKVWVPIKSPGTGNTMWYDEGDEISKYIKGFAFDYDPEKTLRMSWVQDFKDQVQLLIPPELVKPSGALGLSAVCKEKIDDLPDKTPINYDDWHENIRGDRGPQIGSDGKQLRRVRREW